jgi:hypothetical protein
VTAICGEGVFFSILDIADALWCNADCLEGEACRINCGFKEIIAVVFGAIELLLPSLVEQT